MAYGTALSDLVAMARRLARHSASTSVGTATEDAFKEQLRLAQEVYYDRFDWPHLSLYDDFATVAGTQYYTVPAEINRDRIIDIAAWWGGNPLPLERGIGLEDYASHDSFNDERSDPPLKFDFRWRPGAPGETKLELWPIPAVDDIRVRLYGLRPLAALSDDADLADLDDQLLARHVAADYLRIQGSGNAEAMAQSAEARYRALIANSQTQTEPVTLAGTPRRRLRGQSVIRVSSS